MKITVLLVSMLCVGMLRYLILIKKQIRHMTNELKQSRHMLYNKQIRVQLFDRDLNELAKESNYNLDFQADCKRKAMRQEEAAKRAISDIAHDLRTPLTVVKGNLQLLGRAGTLGEKERSYLQICENKTEELKGMADAFFELSMLESDTAKVDLEAVDITGLLFQTVLEHEGLIKGHGLTPNLEIPEKTLLVQGSRQLLERMLGNISLYGGRTEKELAKARERMSFMIEIPYAKLDLTAWQNLEKQRIQKGIPDKRRMEEVMNLVGLSDVGNKKLKEYSLGMKQRFGIANALLAKPETLILDEPVNGLDPGGIVEIREMLMKLNREEDVTILISSHILSELALMCSEYLFIAGGRNCQAVDKRGIKAGMPQLLKARHGQ